MKVILIKDVQGLGRSGDIKEVSEGHARNFLFAKHLALPATTAALQKLQKEEKEHQEKVKRELVRMEDAKNKLSGKTFQLRGEASKNNLFAAIHEKQIAQIIKSKTKIDINPDQIKLPHTIKSLGTHEIEVKFTENIYAKVKIEVKAA